MLFSPNFQTLKKVLNFIKNNNNNKFCLKLLFFQCLKYRLQNKLKILQKRKIGLIIII